MSATDEWLGAVSGVLEPLPGPAGVAERLLLLLHYGIDWSEGWVGRRRETYWERLLVDRVVVCTYRAETLNAWWSQVADELESGPRNARERQEVARLLATRPEGPVLEVLRVEAPALALRTRIVAESVRAGRETVSA